MLLHREMFSRRLRKCNVFIGAVMAPCDPHASAERRRAEIDAVRQVVYAKALRNVPSIV